MGTLVNSVRNYLTEMREQSRQILPTVRTPAMAMVALTTADGLNNGNLSPAMAIKREAVDKDQDVAIRIQSSSRQTSVTSTLTNSAGGGQLNETPLLMDVKREIKMERNDEEVAEKKQRDEVAASLLMFSENAVEHGTPMTVKSKLIAPSIQTSHVVVAAPPPLTLASLQRSALPFKGSQFLPIVTSAGGNAFANYRANNGQLTKIVAVHRLETTSALPYNQLIKVVNELPTLVAPKTEKNGSGASVVGKEAMPRIVFQCNQGGTYVTLPTLSMSTATTTVIPSSSSNNLNNQSTLTAPYHMISHPTPLQTLAIASSAVRRGYDTMNFNFNGGGQGRGQGGGGAQPGASCSFASSSSATMNAYNQMDYCDTRSNSSGYSGASSQDDHDDLDDDDDDQSDCDLLGKRGRKVKYPRTEGSYNPVKEFRNRQRKQQNEEDELLANLERDYAKLRWANASIEELYVKHDLVEIVPQKTEKRIKRKEAENLEEKKMRKRLQARRDSKNYREREKRRRDFITKRIKLLQQMIGRGTGGGGGSGSGHREVTHTVASSQDDWPVRSSSNWSSSSNACTSNGFNCKMISKRPLVNGNVNYGSTTKKSMTSIELGSLGSLQAINAVGTGTVTSMGTSSSGSSQGSQG